MSVLATLCVCTVYVHFGDLTRLLFLPPFWDLVSDSFFLTCSGNLSLALYGLS